MVATSEPAGIFVVGALGRMGRAIHEASSRPDAGVRWIGGLDREADPALGVVDACEHLPEGVDVVLDFSGLQGLTRALALCRRARVPLVTGTTGLDDALEADLEAAAEEVAVLASPNMSLGVNVLFRLARDLVRALDGTFDFEIVEIHHNRKHDAPSGTARRLVEVIAAEREVTEVVPGRDGMPGPRRPEEIGVHAVRAGDVVGEHRLIAAGQDEVLELVHRAGSRQALARGAVKAAAWLAGRAPGVYTMADVLGF